MSTRWIHYVFMIALLGVVACGGGGEETEDRDAQQDPAPDATDGDGDGETVGDVANDDTAPPDVLDIAPDDAPPSDGCLAGPFLEGLGKNHILVGGAMTDETADAAPFDFRYTYIAGGIFDGDAPCASCATDCTAGGQSCANSAGGCGWWGCWQWDQVPPGQYLLNHVEASTSRGMIPMVSYYEILQASGVGEGATEVEAANDESFMRRYFADWRFLMQTFGATTAFVHHEPDFWGYAEQYANEHSGGDPHGVPAAVAPANPDDCGGMENSIAGLGGCLIAMARIYAPNVRVGLHASGWGTGVAALYNGDSSFDVPAEARKLGTFLKECGAGGGDFVVADLSDRDAGYAESQGSDLWWDETNGTLPNFHQGFDWARAVAETVGRPILWWQLPLGNMSLPDAPGQWKDNRLDYFFAHTGELAGSHAAGMAFGAGIADQTTPETDGGNFISKTQQYAAGGGQAPCP